MPLYRSLPNGIDMAVLNLDILLICGLFSVISHEEVALNLQVLYHFIFMLSSE